MCRDLVDRAPAYGRFTGEDVQAMWHVRGFMAAAAAGMDRMQIYMLRDVQPAGELKFLTAGLVSCKELFWQPKRSWYTLFTLNTLIGEMRFEEVLGPSEIDASLNGYRFVRDSNSSSSSSTGDNDGGATEAIVVWSPTKSSRVVQQAEVTLSTTAPCPSSLTRAELVMNSTNGNQVRLEPSTTTVGGGGCVVRVDVGEMPTILLVGVEPEPATGAVPPITPPASGICKMGNGSALLPGVGDPTAIILPFYRIRDLYSLCSLRLILVGVALMRVKRYAGVGLRASIHRSTVTDRYQPGQT